jgi:hypothetical protein
MMAPAAITMSQRLREISLGKDMAVGFRDIG